ncbi:tol-pal system protein YbgF [Luteitalea sp.]|uniref:tol-pal system protein YbgF n=1 Tax=Luteitalea sp. TaxID=2004800 RepID=UPI0025B93496|nr:tol-pal system protein YbgF [Luteitalea sp.]
MTRIVIGALTGVLLVGLAQPAHAANREHQQLMADIRMLQEQSQQLQLVLVSLADTLKTLNAKLDDQSSTSRKQFADQKLLIDNLSSDLRVVRERVDENNTRVGTLGQELTSLRDAVNTLPSQLMPPPAPVTMIPGPGGTMVPAPAGPAAGAPGTAGPTAPVTAAPVPTGPAGGLSPQRMFDTAQADYAAGQWPLAISGFEQFIRSFPTSDKSDDAQFYIGESYQLDGKFKEAVGAYEQVIADYPSGDRVPQALYKRGVALSLLGENDRARESFQQVIRNYPQSEVAVLAKQVLDGLNRRPRD